MDSVKNYDINIPDVCINAILKEIERNGSINEAVAHTTASKDMEIQELKRALQLMQERLEKAEAAVASKNQRSWHR